jgi:hypothetical protein
MRLPKIPPESVSHLAPHRGSLPSLLTNMDLWWVPVMGRANTRSSDHALNPFSRFDRILFPSPAA